MNMKKLIIISVVIHAVLIAVLAPVIKTRMEFDEKEEAQRTVEVKQREAERKEQDRLRREKQKLDEKTAKMLKREAELRKKEEIKQQVKELRKKRDEMMERRERELEKFRERAEKDVLAREKTKFNKVAAEIKKHIDQANGAAERTNTVLGRYPNEDKGMLNGLLDDLQVSNRIWTDGEIANEAQAPVSSDYTWTFETDPEDPSTPHPFKLDFGAEIVPRDEGAGRALNLTGRNPLVKLGPVEYGNAFTIAVSLRVDSRNGEEQIALTNGHSGNYNSTIRFLVSGNEGGGQVVFRTTGKKNQSARTSTAPGSFTFGKWVRVVTTTDIESGTVRIFIDGREMELVESELAEGVNTDASDLSELKEMTDEAVAKLIGPGT